MKELTSTERRVFRARAHSLNPVVIIGNGGLTPGVAAEVERSLKAHELIKIRVGGMEHAEREAVCEALCDKTGAAPVQHIGKILVLYRERPAETSTTPAGKPQKKAPPPGKRVRKPTARPAASGRSGSYNAGRVRRPSTARG